MTTSNPEQGKTIGNIAILDLRDATDSTVEGIERIGNVAMVIFSRETAHLVPRLNFGNVALTVELPREAQFSNGQTFIGRDHFKDVEQPMDLAANGQVFFEQDIPVEDIRNGLASLTVNGQLLYPENLAGVINSKVSFLNGQRMPYIRADYVTMSRLVLDENYLHSLKDGSSLVVIASLDLPQVLPNELLERKISRVQVIGGVRCHQENLSALTSLLAGRVGQARITSIPAGHHLVEGSVRLTEQALGALPAPRLYCAGTVEIADDVAPQTLDEKLVSLVAEDIVICPAHLRDVIYRKCDSLESRVVIYEGELWLVDDETELVPSRFDFLEGRATCIVSGELHISPDVEPGVLAEKFAAVHNFGEIFCTPEQRGAIEARIETNEGEILDSLEGDEVAEEGMGNVAYLKL